MKEKRFPWAHSFRPWSTGATVLGLQQTEHHTTVYIHEQRHSEHDMEDGDKKKGRGEHSCSSDDIQEEKERKGREGKNREGDPRSQCHPL